MCYSLHELRIKRRRARKTSSSYMHNQLCCWVEYWVCYWCTENAIIHGISSLFLFSFFQFVSSMIKSSPTHDFFFLHQPPLTLLEWRRSTGCLVYWLALVAENSSKRAKKCREATRQEEFLVSSSISSNFPPFIAFIAHKIYFYETKNG